MGASEPQDPFDVRRSPWAWLILLVTAFVGMGRLIFGWDYYAPPMLAAAGLLVVAVVMLLRAAARR
jgi:hypothetical protein